MRTARIPRSSAGKPCPRSHSRSRETRMTSPRRRGHWTAGRSLRASRRGTAESSSGREGSQTVSTRSPCRARAARSPTRSRAGRSRSTRGRLRSGSRRARWRPVAAPATRCAAPWSPSARVRVNGKVAPRSTSRAGSQLPSRGSRRARSSCSPTTRRATRPTADSRSATAPRLPRNPVRAVHVSADAWAHDGLRADVLKLLRREADQHRRARSQGRAGHRRLALRRAARAEDRRRAGHVRPRRGREAPPCARRAGDRPARGVPRPRARRVGVDARPARPRDPDARTAARTPAATAGSRATCIPPSARTTSISPSRRRSSASTTSSTTTFAGRTGRSTRWSCPGLDEAPEQAVTDFLAQARRRLAPHDTFLGASVFGIAATRPEEIAQDVPAIAREVDYVAPMLYPSHWGPQEYGVANPESEPYAIVRRSLVDFRRIVRGTGARVVPWLQDFSLGVQYGEPEVRAQIDAASAADIDEFLLWDPTVTYTGAALETDAALPAAGSRASAPGSDELVTLPRSRSPEDPVRSGLEPNELGVVPVLMYHQLLAGRRRRLRPHARRVPRRAPAALRRRLPAGDGVSARDRGRSTSREARPRSS